MGRGRCTVGIDLGTTHTVVARAYAGEAPAIVPIAQLEGRAELSSLPLLPSVLYAPLDSERVTDPNGEPPFVVGAWARHRGAEVPGRSISSAKSWLGHVAVDREAAILPWGTGEGGGVPMLSPVEASARILRHLRRAYNASFGDCPLEEADITLTVPASFDETARELTLKAAAMAGLHVRLLEEPQAAFYDFLSVAEDTAKLALPGGGDGTNTVLVCDVGGGTTDLSLIRVKRDEGAHGITFDRVAVGRHLLLGGDNMDITLAMALEPQLAAAGERLPADEFQQLVVACSSAKERLLGASPPESVRVSLASRGSSLVGKTRSATLTREEARGLLVDGFFPLGAQLTAPAQRRGAVVGFGLPYERDVAITRHIVQFLQRHAAGAPPKLLLLNGGVVKSPLIAQRIQAAVSEWSGEDLTVLAHPRPERAVALGAVAYGLALAGHGVRIGGGSAHGYYVGIDATDEGVPLGVCVVPRGAREGERHVTSGRPFLLTVGRPVRFDLYASDVATDAVPGAIVPLVRADFDRLPPLVTTIPSEGASTEVAVQVEGELSAVGTLDLSCVPASGLANKGARYRLHFQLQRGLDAPGDDQQRAPVQVRDDARALLQRAFGKALRSATGREAKDLVRELELLQGERASWSLATIRSLFDELIPLARGRRRSADHERVFWLLAGFLARPGIGALGDEARIDAMSLLFDEKLAFPSEPRGATQFWIAWRRVAPGLLETVQTRIRDTVDAWLAPAEVAPKRSKKAPLGTFGELLDVASRLERVPVARRSELGGWLLERTWTSRDPALWNALGRIGARVPAYASAHFVVQPSVVERWIDHALREKWTEVPAAGAACAELARMTGDRARDVSPSVRRDVVRKLVASGADAPLVQMVNEVVEMKLVERTKLLGDDLPAGLRLGGDTSS